MKKLINIWLWKQPIYLLWDSNPEEYSNLLKELEEEEDTLLEYSIGRTNMLDSWYIVIYVRWLEDKNRMLLTLNHEIFHAVNYSLETRWVKPDWETYTYTMEYIQKKCYKAIWLDINFKKHKRW